MEVGDVWTGKGSVSRLLQFLEVLYDVAVVAVAACVELVPQVAHDDGASETVVFYFVDVVERHASEGHYITVD